MAGAFTNPRASALPCELMACCSFSETFKNSTTVADNVGTISGAGTVIDRGVTFDGSGYVAFPAIGNAGNFSLVIKFKTSGNGTLWSNHYPVVSSGLYVKLTENGIKASHVGVGSANELVADVVFDDGEYHVVTYSVDYDTGTHTLYFDDDDPVIDTTSVSSPSPYGGVVYIGSSYAGDSYTGEVKYIKGYDRALVQADHDLYYLNDKITSFGRMPYASYRCDDFGNDTDGNKVWDRTTNVRHLHKADRVTTGAFPTFYTNKYSFDGADDYLSNIPTLPNAYTVTVAKSSPYDLKPSVEQVNDTTLTDDLKAPGGYYGYLHGMVVHSSELSIIQQKHDEYMHLFAMKRGLAERAHHQLITQGTCKLAVFFHAETLYWRDYSRRQDYGLASNVTLQYAGADFLSSDSVVKYNDDEELRLNQGTVAVMGDFTSDPGTTATLVDKGASFKFQNANGILAFNGSVLILPGPFDQNTHLAVTFKTGNLPMFYIDGEFVGKGNLPILADDTDTEALTIGNDNALAQRARQTLKQVCICDKPLADHEIRSLYQSSLLTWETGVLEMEVGQRLQHYATETGALDKTLTPGGSFRLVDVNIQFSAAPTTSELIEIFSISGGVEYLEWSTDPSLSLDSNAVVDFDNKIFNGGDSIRITYANTDSRTITLKVNTILDDAVSNTDSLLDT